MKLEQFADAMKGASGFVGSMSVELLEAFTQAAYEEAKAIAHAARDTGELEESAVKRKNHVTLDAPHANIIDRSRKRGFTPRGQKRIRPSRAKGKKAKLNPKAPMYGSKKAKRGISKPAKKAVLARSEQIMKGVVDRFEDRLLPGGGGG